MKQSWIISLCFYCFTNCIQGQNLACETVNYQDSIYEWAVEPSLLYAVKSNDRVTPDSLTMDVYYPINDLKDRPLIMIAYGGAFVTGSKESMAFLAERLASRGYVAVTFDYRLYHLGKGIIGLNTIFRDVALNAMDDMADATNGVLQRAEQFAIDTNTVFLCGASAGAIMSLHLGYVDSLDTFEGDFKDNFQLRESFWSFDRSKIKGIINLSGAVLDTVFINNDIATISYHGDMDDVVPYEEGLANGILILQGSRLIHEQLERKGIVNYLETVQGGAHTDIYFDAKFAGELRDFELKLWAFLAKIICPITTSIYSNSVPEEVNIYPNPFVHEIFVETSKASNVTYLKVFNQIGQVVAHEDISAGINELQLKQPSGIYYVVGYRDNQKSIVFREILVKR